MQITRHTLASTLIAVSAVAITSCSNPTPDPPAPAGSTVINVQCFDPGLLGRDVAESPQTMLPAHDDAIAPTTVHLDAQDGKYIGATITYPKAIRLEPMRDALNQLHSEYEILSFAEDPGMGLWRNTDDRYAIQLTENDDSIQVIYLTFQPNQRVLENLMNTTQPAVND